MSAKTKKRAGKSRRWSARVMQRSNALDLEPNDYSFRVPPAFLKAEGKYDIRPKLKTILAPVLLLQGRQDLADEANVCEAQSLIKNSTLAFIGKCGHMPWLEQPEQTWKIVDEFLAHLPN